MMRPYASGRVYGCAMVMYGLDAASFQGVVDWAAVDAWTGFGWEKATQGRGYVNPYWAAARTAMAARAAASGFVPGAYLFLEEGHGAAQADHFAAVAGDLDGFALAVDIEPAGNSRPSLADGVACVARLRHHYPRHPVGGYIPHWYWDGQDTTFCDYLWQSHYLIGIGTPRSLYPRAPASWWDGYGGSPVSLLQFTSTGVVGGVAGLVDCSAYRGTPAELRALVLPNLTPPPPPPLPPDWLVTLVHSLPTLRRGDQHHMPVRRAQALLGPAGAHVTVDGLFGPATEAAVRQVQHAHGMHQTGTVDPGTWALLITGAP